MVETKVNDGYLASDLGNVEIVNSPKEIKISGKISRVYVEGNDLHKNFVFDRSESSATQETSKKKNKGYIIVPIKDKNSAVHYMKVPIYKLNKKPDAKNIGTVNCEKINPSGETVLTEELDKWCTHKRQLQPIVPLAWGAPPAERRATEEPPGRTEKPEPENRDTAPSEQEKRNQSFDRMFRLLPHLVTVKEKTKHRRLFSNKAKKGG